jgi:hypothetical protein
MESGFKAMAWPISKEDNAIKDLRTPQPGQGI